MQIKDCVLTKKKHVSFFFFFFTKTIVGVCFSLKSKEKFVFCSVD